MKAYKAPKKMKARNSQRHKGTQACKARRGRRHAKHVIQHIPLTSNIKSKKNFGIYPLLFKLKDSPACLTSLVDVILTQGKSDIILKGFESLVTALLSTESNFVLLYNWKRYLGDQKRTKETKISFSFNFQGICIKFQ